MAEFIKVMKVSDLPAGNMRTVVAGGKRIALANVEGEYFAVDDTCTHEQCSLGTEGFLDGNVITCGCHGTQFDVTNGKVLAPPATVDVVTYTVKVEGIDILVQI